MPTPENDPIKHVVLLMLENHSFDQMLGALQDVYPDLDGVHSSTPRINLDNANNPFPQQPTKERQMLLDPHHELEHVNTQLAGGNAGFVKDFQSDPTYHPTDAAKQFIMGYYPCEQAPLSTPSPLRKWFG